MLAINLRTARLMRSSPATCNMTLRTMRGRLQAQLPSHVSTLSFIAQAPTSDSMGQSALVEGLYGFAELASQRRSRVSVGDDFDVGASLRLRSRLEGRVELGIRCDPTHEPVVAAERVGELCVSPGCDIVVRDRGLFAEESLDQIPVVVEYKYDWTKTQTCKLSQLLDGQLMRAVAR